MSFGYGIGDFIAGANLSYRLIKALSESQGASIEYQQAIAEISSLQQTFLQVSQMRASKTLSQATINMAEVIVMSFMELIGGFLTKTHKYREQLCGRRSNGNASASWQKMGWVLFKKEELRQLWDELHLKLSHISLLFTTVQIHTKTPASVAKYEVNEFDDPSPEPQPWKTSSQTEKFKTEEANEKPGTKPTERPQTRDLELEKRLLAIEGLMKAQKFDFEGAQEEIAAKKAEELALQQKAEAEKIAAQRAAEKKAAWEKKLKDEMKAAQLRGAENAKKMIEAERKKAEEKVAEEEAREAARAAVIEAESNARTNIEKVEAEAKAVIDKVQKEAREAVAKAQEDAEFLIQKALAPQEERKKPIKFKDAVGRKFSFPFHLCTTWAGMEELIRQAFLHVEVIGPHVQDGRYDLMGPNGEIILPQVWETIIEPDWSITMHMWPIPEPETSEQRETLRPSRSPARKPLKSERSARVMTDSSIPKGHSRKSLSPQTPNLSLDVEAPSNSCTPEDDREKKFGVIELCQKEPFQKRDRLPGAAKSDPPTSPTPPLDNYPLPNYLTPDAVSLDSGSQAGESASSTLVESEHDERERTEFHKPQQNVADNHNLGTELEMTESLPHPRRRRPRRRRRRPKPVQAVTDERSVFS